jgi:hypothetical protein
MRFPILSRAVSVFLLSAVLPILAFSPALVRAVERGGVEDRLSYYSDYFSFVGADSRGRVAFALDTNRGQDGAEFQAEHFAALHEEHGGWQDVHGSGAFPNPEGTLETIPDSAYFRFTGAPEEGMVIESPQNDLILRIQPVTIHLSRDLKRRFRRMGSAPASLEWGGRMLKGRVIYEFLHYDNWNRLTRRYWGYWRDFQGFYLVVGDTASEEKGDFYLASRKARGDRSKKRVVDGFAVLDRKAIRLQDAEIAVKRRDLALGFYRWPRQWVGQWPAGENKSGIRFRFRRFDRRSFGNWVIGGFAMSIVAGSSLIKASPSRSMASVSSSNKKVPDHATF